MLAKALIQLQKKKTLKMVISCRKACLLLSVFKDFSRGAMPPDFPSFGPSLVPHSPFLKSSVRPCLQPRSYPSSLPNLEKWKQPKINRMCHVGYEDRNYNSGHLSISHYQDSWRKDWKNSPINSEKHPRTFMKSRRPCSCLGTARILCKNKVKVLLIKQAV